jgi:hypothetical protein
MGPGNHPQQTESNDPYVEQCFLWGIDLAFGIHHINDKLD